MKVVLKTGQEYQVASVFELNNTQICIAFTEIEDYGTLRSALTEESLEEFKYYSDEVSYTVYEDYIKFLKSSVVETENGLDIAMYFEKENEVILAIKKLKDTNDELINDINDIAEELTDSQTSSDNAIAELTIMLGQLFGLIL